jgi:hypothetical protein
MLPFPSKINNHKHCSNVYDEGKKRLDEKMIEWEKNVETREMKKYGVRRNENKNEKWYYKIERWEGGKVEAY